MIETISAIYEPYRFQIREALSRVAAEELSEQCDFLWLAVNLQDGEGLPIKVYPCERNQQQHDGWKYEDRLIDSVPDDVELPEGFFGTLEAEEKFVTSLFEYIRGIWLEIGTDRLAYYSDWDGGTYYALSDGRAILAWDIEAEVTEIRQAEQTVPPKSDRAGG